MTTCRENFVITQFHSLNMTCTSKIIKWNFCSIHKMLVRFILVLFSPSHIIKVGDKVKARRNCQQQVVYTTSCYQNKKENESIRKLSKTALTCDVDLCTFGEKWNNKVAMECVIFTLFLLFTCGLTI